MPLTLQHRGMMPDVGMDNMEWDACISNSDLHLFPHGYWCMRALPMHKAPRVEVLWDKAS